MSSLFRVLFANPTRAAIVVGLAVAIGFGLFSLPEPKLFKSASEITPARILSGEEGEQLSRAYRNATNGEGELIQLTKEEFEAAGFPFAATFPAEQSGNRFFLRHVAQASLGDNTVYIWEQDLFAAPWWSPHRFVYKAVEAETGAFGQVVRLTFERDVLGLTGLLLFDALLGVVYGAVVGLIVAVRRFHLTPPPNPDPRTHSGTRMTPRRGGA
jgi:hypothetical protein